MKLEEDQLILDFMSIICILLCMDVDVICILFDVDFILMIFVLKVAVTFLGIDHVSSYLSALKQQFMKYLQEKCCFCSDNHQCHFHSFV